VARDDLACDLVGSPDREADERWRAVLFELLQRAKGDPEFRARVEATGAIVDHFEVVLERVREKHATAPSGAIVAREEWWGFQLAIPHAVLAVWTEGATESITIVDAIGTVPGAAGTFVRRAAGFIANRVGELQALDRGDGVHVSMTWMAPNVFVPQAR
jgi:hypothetical protein